MKYGTNDFGGEGEGPRQGAPQMLGRAAWISR